MIFYTISFLGPFLLFFLEIFAPQILLPKFGGSHQVFITSLVFFTGILFFSNLLFHWISKKYSFKKILDVYFVIGILSPLFLLNDLTFEIGNSAYFNVFIYLTIKFGPLFFFLSLITPIVQLIIGHESSKSDEDVYKFYSVSNLGSFMGLLSGPLLIDIFFDHTQKLYFISFIYFLNLVLFFKSYFFKRTQFDFISSNQHNFDIKYDERNRLGIWIIFSSIPTLFMISATNFISIHYGSVPLVWVVPLGILLLSFILCFKGGLRPKSSHILLLGILSIVLLEFLIKLNPNLKNLSEFIYHLIILFVVCIISINRLYLSKPEHKSLTLFYVSISFGGFLGALTLGLIIPIVFYNLSSNILEYAFSSVILLLGIFSHSQFFVKQTGLFLTSLLLFVGFYFGAHYFLKEPHNVLEMRSFYGLTKVKDLNGQKEFYHNNSIHGIEVNSEAIKRPYVYYFEESPIGEFFNSLSGIKNVANIGLGVGSLQYYSKEGQDWDLFDIDKNVFDLAKNNFHFLPQSKSNINEFLGDGRKMIGKMPNNKYDLIILDVFSGPQIPFHFLTLEAFELYLNKLNSNGIIAVHISNSTYNFLPLLRSMMNLLKLHYFSKFKINLNEHTPKRNYPNSWFFVGKNYENISRIAREMKVFESFNKREQKNIRPWTDEYFNIFSVLY